MSNFVIGPVNQVSKSTKLLKKYQAQKPIVREQLSKMFSEASL